MSWLDKFAKLTRGAVSGLPDNRKPMVQAGFIGA